MKKPFQFGLASLFGLMAAAATVVWLAPAYQVVSLVFAIVAIAFQILIMAAGAGYLIRLVAQWVASRHDS